MKKEQSVSKLPTLKRRVAYTLAAGAAAAGTAGVGVPEASAEIVYSGLYDLSISAGYNLPLSLDYAAGSLTTDIRLWNSFGNGDWQNVDSVFPPGRLVGFFAGPSGFAYASALETGDLIDSTTVGSINGYASLAYGATNPNAEFNSTGPDGKYLGLSFPAPGGLKYAWIRVEIENEDGLFVVKDWAYNNTPGAGINAGQVPEPATLGLLAAGSVGLLAMRRRKQAA